MKEIPLENGRTGQNSEGVNGLAEAEPWLSNGTSKEKDTEGDKVEAKGEKQYTLFGSTMGCLLGVLAGFLLASAQSSIQVSGSGFISM